MHSDIQLYCTHSNVEKIIDMHSKKLQTLALGFALSKFYIHIRLLAYFWIANQKHVLHHTFKYM